MKHNIIHFYASNNFDKNELDAIREAKKKAISEKYISSYIEEIGTGSSNKTTVFCIPNPEIPGDMLALKIISYVTIAYPNLKFYEAIKALKNDTCKGNRIIQEIQNCLKTQDCRNVIPLSGFDTLIWQCPAYNRVGIDYILKMPLAMFAYIYMIAGMFKDGWTDSQKKQVLSYARQHFTPYASAIKQNYYVLRRALEVIGLFDDNFADFCTEYMGRVYGDSTQFKNVILQLVIRYEKDDKKVADFLNKFFHLSDFNKWIAALMANRFGMETTKENQKCLVKFIKTITPGLAISGENDTSQYAAVLISDLCANKNDNPICTDSYTMKHTWSVLGKYLSTQQDSLFVSAVTNLWNGTDLSIEETTLVHTILSA